MVSIVFENKSDRNYTDEGEKKTLSKQHNWQRDIKNWFYCSDWAEWYGIYEKNGNFTLI